MVLGLAGLGALNSLDGGPGGAAQPSSSASGGTLGNVTVGGLNVPDMSGQSIVNIGLIAAVAVLGIVLLRRR